jgi:hypothetical protein
MGTVVKVLLALVIGVGVLHFVQQRFMSSMRSQMAAAPQAPEWFTAHPEVPTAKFDADAFRRQLDRGIGPIDTRPAVRAGTLDAARQADILRRRAEDAVPLPRH